jgi:hypothetical protein
VGTYVLRHGRSPPGGLIDDQVQEIGKVLLQSEEYYPNDRSMADDWVMAGLIDLKRTYKRSIKQGRAIAGELKFLQKLNKL